MSTEREAATVGCSALLDEDELRILLTHKLEASYQKDVARDLRVSAGYLNDFMHCRRAPGAKLLAALGYERVTMYRRLPSNAR